MKKSATVTAEIVRIGNSYGVRLPKAIREQAGLIGKVSLTVSGDTVVIRPSRRLRAGWQEQFARAKPQELSEDEKAWLGMPNEEDDKEWTW